MMTVCTTVVSVDRLNRARQIQVKNEQFLTSRPQCYKALQRDWTCPGIIKSYLPSLRSTSTTVPKTHSTAAGTAESSGFEPCTAAMPTARQKPHRTLPPFASCTPSCLQICALSTLDHPQRHGCRKQARLLFSAFCIALSQTPCMPLFAPST